MDVDLLAPNGPGVVGGIEGHVDELATALGQRGHDVQWMHPGPGQGPGTRVLRTRWSLGYYARQFDAELLGDVASVHGFGIWGNARAILKSEHPAVWSLHHGLDFPRPWLAQQLWRHHERNLGGRALRHAAALVVNTQQDVERLLTMGVARDQIHEIPVGVPIEPSKAARPVPEPYAMFLGRLDATKGVFDLVRAWGAEDGCLQLFGPSSPDADRLIALVQQLGKADRIQVQVGQPWSVVAAHLRHADCLLLPSEHEGLGKVILEAWVNGTPTVAFAVGGVPHVIRDGHDGCLVPAGAWPEFLEAARGLRSRPTQARTMGARGRKKVEQQYELNATRDALMDLIEKVAT